MPIHPRYDLQTIPQAIAKKNLSRNRLPNPRSGVKKAVRDMTTFSSKAPNLWTVKATLQVHLQHSARPISQQATKPPHRHHPTRCDSTTTAGERPPASLRANRVSDRCHLPRVQQRQSVFDVDRSVATLTVRAMKTMMIVSARLGPHRSRLERSDLSRLLQVLRSLLQRHIRARSST